MPASSHILVASDLSPRCDRALERACTLASAAGPKLHVLTVIEGENREPSWRGDGERPRAPEAEFVSRLETRTGRTGAFKRLIEYGDVDRLVRDFARTQQPD